MTPDQPGNSVSVSSEGTPAGDLSEPEDTEDGTWLGYDLLDDEGFDPVDAIGRLLDKLL